MLKRGWLAGTMVLGLIAAVAPLQAEDDTMELGRFSVSLTVKDLQKSREFYTKLGFTVWPSDYPGYNESWVILEHGTSKIGLFQGMFDKNTLTFNPADVRAIQRELQARGVKLLTEADATTTGPAHVTLEDPDGNPILLDQH